MKYEAFFFDFDGVLVDSVEVKTRAFVSLFEPYGETIVAEVVDYHRKNSGLTRREKILYYYDSLLRQSVDQKEIDTLCEKFSRLVVSEVVAAPEIPGAEAFLKSCQGNIPCFVISATPEEELRHIVESRGWTKYFEDIRGAPLLKQENILSITVSRGFTTESCLFFGDAIADYRAAKLCGMRFMAVLPNRRAPLLEFAPEVQWIRDFSNRLFLIT